MTSKHRLNTGRNRRLYLLFALPVAGAVAVVGGYAAFHSPDEGTITLTGSAVEASVPPAQDALGGATPATTSPDPAGTSPAAVSSTGDTVSQAHRRRPTAPPSWKTQSPRRSITVPVPRRPTTKPAPTTAVPGTTAAPVTSTRTTSPSTTRPTTTKPPAQPSTTQPSTTRPSTTKPSTTQPSTTAPVTVPAGGGSLIDQVVSLTNQQRIAQGCPALSVDPALTSAAQAHSADMARRNFFDHVNPDGKDPFTRMKDAGYRYRMAAENIAAGYPTAQKVVEGWMNSEGHRKNILNCGLTEIGVGYATGGSYGTYWTQNFGTPL